MRKPAAAFTLVEVVMALGLLALLTGGVYAIASAALDASRHTMDEQFTARRLESFVRVTRDAFLNLPAQGEIVFRMGKSPSGAPIPEIVFREAAGVFGIPSLGGGSLVLAARPRADGSRTFAILRIPKNLQGQELARYAENGPWVSLLPGMENVRWTFFINGEWHEDWPDGRGRPILVRLQAESRDFDAQPLDLQFWIPPIIATPLAAPSSSPSGPQPSPSPRP